MNGLTKLYLLSNYDPSKSSILTPLLQSIIREMENSHRSLLYAHTQATYCLDIVWFLQFCINLLFTFFRRTVLFCFSSSKCISYSFGWHINTSNKELYLISKPIKLVVFGMRNKTTWDLVLETKFDFLCNEILLKQI